VTAESNAVNLTDGLDGLAISIFAIAATAYTALAYVVGNRVLAEYLLLNAFLTGGGADGVLRNRSSARRSDSSGTTRIPPKSSWADVGSLALGAALGTVAILIKQELLLVIGGGVFVLEALSVVIQVASFKTTGKRVFRMAPLHHHFELIGWSEPEGHFPAFVIVAIIFGCSFDDVEAQMTFDVKGKRVTVAGAARSGLAAAELLARRGADVTLSEARMEIPGAEALQRLGVRLEVGGHVTDTFTQADLVVLSRGCRRISRPFRPRAIAACPSSPRSSGLSLAAGPRDCDHRDEREIDHHGVDRPDARGGRLQGHGRRQHRRPLSAQVAESTPDTFHVVETSSFQLEQIDTFHPWIAVMLNFRPITSIVIRASRRTRRRKRGSSSSRRPRTGPW